MHKLQIVPQICICDASRPSASNSLPSADHPFGAKSQYGPTVTSIRHPEPHEGRPALIDPMPVPLQRAAVSVPRTCPQHGQSAIVSPHGSRSNDTSIQGPSLQCVLPGRRDESRRVVADESRTSEVENTFTSCLPALDRPSNKLSMSTCWWPHD